MISIKDALDGALGSARLGTVSNLLKIRSNWGQIVGEQLCGVCSPVYIWQKTLIIHVSDPAFMTPLDYSRLAILAKTQKILGENNTVQNISVRYNEDKAREKLEKKPADTTGDGDPTDAGPALDSIGDSSLKGALESMIRAATERGRRILAMSLLVGMAASCVTTAKPNDLRTSDAVKSSKKPASKNERKLTAEDVARKAALDRDAYFYFIRAQMMIHENKLTEALADLKVIMEFDPYFVEAYVEIAKLSLALGKTGDAMETAQKGLSISPDNAELNCLLGNIYHNSKEFKRAEEHLKRGLAADPTREDARLNLAFNYQELKQPEKAEAELLEVLKHNPQSGTAMIYLAKTYVDMKAYYKAENFLTGYITNFPEVPQGYAALGWVYAVQMKYDMAIDVYKKCLELFPHDEETQQRLANIYLLKKSYGDALEVYKEIEKDAPSDSADLNLKMGLLYFQQGEYRHALEKFQLVRIKDPANKTISLYVAKIDEELGLFQEAINEWESLVAGQQTDKDKAEIYVKIAGLHEKMKNFEKAEESVRTAMTFKKDDPDLFYILGLINDKKGNYKEAEANVQQATRLAPTKADFVFYLGVIYEKLGDKKKCVDTMKRSLTLNPKLADALNYIGYLYAEQGTNLAEATQYIKKAMEIDPNNGYYEDSMAWVYYRQKKYPLALETILKSVSHLKERDATIYAHLGEIQAALGEWQQAADAYAISVELKEDPDISRKLENARNLADPERITKINKAIRDKREGAGIP